LSYFINLRAGSYGATCEGYVLQGDVEADPPGMISVAYETIPALVKNKNVLLATHGFNVSYVDGLRSLGRLETVLAPTAGEVVFGVLWPGDWAIPAVNYPFEDKIAAQSGRLLAAFCNRWLAGAANLSLMSHSLGARVMLETLAGLQGRRVRNLCIAAGAIGADCLTDQYPAAVENCDAVVTLSSMEDLVLSLAFPVGDLIADILDADHKPFQRALGREGPETPYPTPPIGADQIPDGDGYNHGDYLPPSALAAAVPDPNAKWWAATTFFARAFRGQPQTWPT
jgi:hypothetical protein